MSFEELPVYSYHTASLPQRGDGALYHFTKLESFLKILDDMTLLPSSFGNLNDMNEGNVYNMDMNENFMVMYDAGQYIKDRCHLLCFSQNYDILGYGQEGSNHPAMWAHYADNSNGVCVVIDKKAFLRKNKSILDSHFYQFQDVEYNIFNVPDNENIDHNASTPQEFLRKNWHSLFFLKHKDWEYEDEHRLFIMDYDGKLSIDGCVKHIVLGRKLFLNKTQVKNIMDKVVDSMLACYHKFTPHSFATTCYDTHGYSTIDCSHKILEVVQENFNNPLYAEYVLWLNNEQGYPIKSSK